MKDDRLIAEERELFGAFASLRPDRDAFLEGVQRRIAERSDEGDAESEDVDAGLDSFDREDETSDRNAAPPREAPNDELHAVSSKHARVTERALAGSSFLRAAASFLPPGFLPASVLGLTAKKLTWKAAPALFAMPAIVVVMLFVTFVAALTQVARLDSSVPSSPFLEREEIRRWWRSNRKLASVTIVALVLLAWLRPVDALVGFLLVSIGCLALILRRLSAAGYASRHAVGKKCAGFLFFTGFYGFIFGGQSSYYSIIPRSAVPILFAGALVCAYAAWDGIWERLRQEKRKKLGAGSGAVIVLLIHLLPGLWFLATPFFTSPLDVDDLRQHVETRHDLAAYRWAPAARATAWLNERGLEVDASGLRSSLDAWNHVGDDNQILAYRAGLVTFDELRAFTEKRRFGSWRRFEIPKEEPLKRHQLTTDTKPYLLAGGGDMTDEERASLTRRALQGWPEEGEWRPLQVARGMVEVLDALGATEEFESQVPRLHALLVEHWAGTHTSRNSSVGFLAQNDFAAREGETRAQRITRWLSLLGVHHSDELSTQDAVWLMHRFGVPQSIELRSVRAWLCNATVSPILWRGPPDPNQIDAAIALDMLDTYFPEARGTLVQRALDQRVLIGVLLLVLFCCIATWRAPRTEPDGGDGPAEAP